MDIYVDEWGRVLVQHGRGPLLALAEDGTVSEVYSVPGSPVWTSLGACGRKDQDDYDKGYDDGYTQALDDAVDRIGGCSPSSYRQDRAKQKYQEKKVETAKAALLEMTGGAVA